MESLALHSLTQPIGKDNGPIAICDYFPRCVALPGLLAATTVPPPKISTDSQQIKRRLQLGESSEDDDLQLTNAPRPLQNTTLPS